MAAIRAHSVDERAESDFDARHFSVIELGTGMSTITGALDNGGPAAVRAAPSMLGQRTEDDQRMISGHVVSATPMPA